MSYGISLSRAAEKYLRRRVPPVHEERIREAIDGLAEDPRPQRRSRKLNKTSGKSSSPMSSTAREVTGEKKPEPLKRPLALSYR